MHADEGRFGEPGLCASQVSVLMSMRNLGRFVEAAVDSILS